MGAMNSEKDHIFIDQFEVSLRIGDSEEERAFPQIVDFSIRIYLPLQEAGEKDDMSHALDYAKVIEAVRNGAKGRTFVLQEGLAEWAAGEILKNKQVESVSVGVAKKNFPGIRRIGVWVHRNRPK